MSYGYSGKILKVNLTTGEIDRENLSEEIMRKYMGGKGLVYHYLKDSVDKDTDPFSKENPLYFMTGVVSGIPTGGTSRMVIGTKSPITGGFGISESGGFVAPELKKAGWDGIIVEGKSEKPVYLLIKDDKVEIKDASHLWGKGNGEVNDIIKEENNDKGIKLSQIGQAGENQVQYACVMNDLKHACGRNGMGAVMGSKKLKAVAIKGTVGVNFKDEEKVKEISKWYAKHQKDHPSAKGLHLYGTAGGVESLDKSGMLPTRNFSQGSFEKAKEISGQTMADTILTQRGGCYGCPVRCKRVVEVNSEKIKVDSKYGGPEYETIGAMGSMCGIGNLDVIAKANEMCNDLGLDTISTGVSISFAMECYEKGIIDKKDTDGVELNFGNEEALLKIIKDISEKKGLGKILSQGVKKASEIFRGGSEEFAMHVKGQELPMHEPRGKVGVGLGYSVSPTGADHMQAAHDNRITEEGPLMEKARVIGLEKPTDPMIYGKDKAEYYSTMEKWWSFLNMVGMCDFIPEPTGSMPIDKFMELINETTGWDVTPEECMEVGERGVTAARKANYDLGIDESHEELPKRLYQPLENGALEGKSMDIDKFIEMKQYYYDILGWDKKGYPTKETLERLGL
ncbi:MAG: aldehyde ferredoxin oxidoreductase family protein [Bacillota bacterium]|nr:aldehyde ferredoxin oxidoreductase family protein [Bacillota bacterium]